MVLESPIYLNQLNFKSIKSNRAFSDKDLIENDSDMAEVKGQIDFKDDLKLNLFRKGPKKIYVNESILKKQVKLKIIFGAYVSVLMILILLEMNPVTEEYGLIKLYLNLNLYI